MVDHASFQMGHTFPYQDVIENAFVLPPTETVDSPASGLRRIEVAHFRYDLPDFLERVAKMRALEHLKIVILEDDSTWEMGDKVSVQHSLSSLEIEGFWWDLSPAINLCPSPSATAQLRTLRLHYHQKDRAWSGASVTQVLDLPAGIIPPDHLEALTIDVVDYPHVEFLNHKAPVLTTNALQPLLRYRQMVRLHLGLPCSICLDIKFLYALAAVMGGTLSHLVVLRAIAYHWNDPFQPMLTVEDLSLIAGVLFPRVETLGLQVPWHDTPSYAERNCSAASFLLKTLLVGTEILFGQESSNVATFLKGCFPGLQYLYRYRQYYEDNDGWQHVVRTNGYSGDDYVPGII